VQTCNRGAILLDHELAPLLDEDEDEVINVSQRI